MARLISNPTRVKAAGNKPKVIEEFIGRVNSGTMGVSIARMRSPAGWVEPNTGIYRVHGGYQGHAAGGNRQ